MYLLDNELPDYIMVMLVNKKTFHQITNDLKLFLGEHTTLFIDWLQEAVTSGNINTGKKKTTTTTGWICVAIAICCYSTQSCVHACVECLKK